MERTTTLADEDRIDSVMSQPARVNPILLAFSAIFVGGAVLAESLSAGEDILQDVVELSSVSNTPSPRRRRARLVGPLLWSWAAGHGGADAAVDVCHLLQQRGGLAVPWRLKQRGRGHQILVVGREQHERRRDDALVAGERLRQGRRSDYGSAVAHCAGLRARAPRVSVVQ